MSAVEVRNLHRVYRTAIGVLVRRKTKEVVAVKDISFDVHPADVEGLLAHGARVVVLSQGFQGRLQVCPETLRLLQERAIPVHMLGTEEAVRVYNRAE